MKNNFCVPKYDGQGVYMIVNVENSMIYIGCSNNINKRAKEHKTELNTGKHPIKELCEAYHRNHVLFLILEKFDDLESTELKLYEKLYMYASIIDGFRLYNKKCVDLHGLKQLAEVIVFDLLHKNDIHYKIESRMKEETGFTVNYMQNGKYRLERLE